MNVATENQWADFWQRIGAATKPAPHWSRLKEAYSESWRAYHNLTHIGHCLSEFANAKSLAQSAEAIEAAIWFHDLVYDTHAKDNEERSAEFGREVLTEGGLPEAFARKVTSLILATKHNHAPTAHDEALMVDIDLSILG